KHPTIEVVDSLPPFQIKIRPVEMKTYKLSNIPVRVEREHGMRYKIRTSKVTLYVLAGENDWDRLDGSEISAIVDLKEASKGRHSSAIAVKLPKNIQLVKMVPDRVDVTLY